MVPSCVLAEAVRAREKARRLDGYAFAFQIGNGGATGLYATGTNTEIMLSATNNPGEVIGRDGSGNVILTLQMDPHTGAVVMTQTVPIPCPRLMAWKVSWTSCKRLARACFPWCWPPRTTTTTP